MYTNLSVNEDLNFLYIVVSFTFFCQIIFIALLHKLYSHIFPLQIFNSPTTFTSIKAYSSTFWVSGIFRNKHVHRKIDNIKEVYLKNPTVGC